jgi:hypothetical protein
VIIELILVAVLLAALVIGAIALVVVSSRSTPGLLDSRLRRRVIVTCKTGDAFAGVLYARDREAIVLRETEALAYGAKKVNVAVEGELVVLRADVAYVQIVPSVP